MSVTLISRQNIIKKPSNIQPCLQRASVTTALPRPGGGVRPEIVKQAHQGLHLIHHDSQSEASKRVTWSLFTNQSQCYEIKLIHQHTGWQTPSAVNNTTCDKECPGRMEDLTVNSVNAFDDTVQWKEKLSKYRWRISTSVSISFNKLKSGLTQPTSVCLGPWGEYFVHQRFI